MAITGTGTQADPYIVTTFAELMAKTHEEGKYVKLGNSINMNNEYPDGFDDTTFAILCTELDGDGYSISNIRIKPGVSGLNRFLYITKESTIKNINFKNIYLTDDQSFDDVNVKYYVHFTGPTYVNCTFSGALYCSSSSYLTYLIRGKNRFSKCSFNVYFYGSYTTIQPSDNMADCTFEECDINFHKESSSQYAYIKIVNSNVTGQVEGLYVLNNSSYSIIDANVNSLYSQSTVTLVICNADKVSWSQNVITRVSDTNLGSTEYLVALGFPIQVNSANNEE